MSATDTLQKAAEAFQSKVQLVRDDQWSGPTPCTEWNVRALVNHVIGEVLWIPPLVAGKTIADVGDTLSGDLLGDDAQSAWDSAARETLKAVREPGAMEQTVHLSYGDRPAQGYIEEVATDLVVHTWDLARGIGADDRLDPALVEFAHGALAPAIEGARAAGYFGAAVEVADDADPQTKLLALTGRRRNA